MASRSPVSYARLAVRGVLLVVFVGLFVFFGWLPGIVEKRMNPVKSLPPYESSVSGRLVHEQLFVADLHADSLLWSRDLSRRGVRGSVDVPRLLEGNVALQVFGIVSKTPKGQNFQANDDSTDALRLLAFAQRWPISTWLGVAPRVHHQAEKLRRVEHDSKGRFRILTAREDLDELIAARKAGERVVGGLLSVEGAHALEGELANVDAFFDAGVRMMSVAHFFDTETGGSAHGVRKGGLTTLGRQMIARMEERGMVLDLSHSSEQTFFDAASAATRPFVVSHTGVRGTCDNGRNLSDEQLRAVQAKDGVVGIAFFEQAVCGLSVAHVVRALLHVIDVVGVHHVALGSDFDGAVAVPFDATGMALLTDALLDAGLSEEEVALVMGGNVVRLLQDTLPRRAQ